jgi:hypothetical protein
LASLGFSAAGWLIIQPDFPWFVHPGGISIEDDLFIGSLRGCCFEGVTSRAWGFAEVHFLFRTWHEALGLKGEDPFTPNVADRYTL